jgi:hypothetical protein
VADVEMCFGARQLCFPLLFLLYDIQKGGRDLSGFSKVEDDMTVRETRPSLKAFSCCREMRCKAARTGCFSRAGLLITTSIEMHFRFWKPFFLVIFTEFAACAQFMISASHSILSRNEFVGGEMDVDCVDLGSA